MDLSNIRKICGIDCGNEQSVAVVLSREEFEGTEPIDLFHQCAFLEMEPNKHGLAELLKIDADLYIIEPTGSYSRIWRDNLKKVGKTCYLIAHEVLAAYRIVCGWRDKDDKHDSLAIAWYGWNNYRRRWKFNRERDAILEIVLDLYLAQKKLASDYVVLNNRSRQLLHREFPEVVKRSTNCGKGGTAPPMWAFIAGRPTANREVTALTKKLNNSIGSAAFENLGKFSPQLQQNAARICDLQCERYRISQEIQHIIEEDERFGWYHEVFDEFQFSSLDRAILLCQIFPFEQFLGENLEEIKIIKKNSKRSKSGKYPKKRVSYNKFHSALGKAPSERSSGNKKALIVSGSNLCREMLYLWANRYIFPTKGWESRRNEIMKYLRKKYENDLLGQNETYKQIVEILKNFLKDDDDFWEIFKQKIGEKQGGKSVISALENIDKKERKKGNLEDKSRNVLKAWAKARVPDKVVKLLYYKLRDRCRIELRPN